MVIESERADLEAADMTFDSQGPFVEVDHDVPNEFGAFIAMHQTIRDEQVHLQLHDDLMEHLWRRNGNAN
jgi:hypothetical protein